MAICRAQKAGVQNGTRTGSGKRYMDHEVGYRFLSLVLLFYLNHGVNAQALDFFASRTTTFAFQSMSPGNFTTVGDAQVSDGTINLNSNGAYKEVSSAGRVLYLNSVQMIGTSTKKAASFETSFSFTVFTKSDTRGDGFAFGIFPDSTSLGGTDKWLGLLNATTDSKFGKGNGTNPSTHLFAVEFDTFPNQEFADADGHHIGVNVNSLVSVDTADTLKYTGVDLANTRFTCWIRYSAAKDQLRIYFATGSFDTAIQPSSPLLTVRKLNLSSIFLTNMYVGFSGGIGGNNELHQVFSWNFSTSFTPTDDFPGDTPSPSPEPDIHGSGPTVSSQAPESLPSPQHSHSSNRTVLIIIGVVVGLLASVCCCGACMLGRKRSDKKKKQALLQRNMSTKTLTTKAQLKKFTSEISSTYGPRRYSYRELRIATTGFREILGRGGFGSVYKGYLNKVPVAVKEVAEDSKQGEREFLAEISIIGRLRHRNLVVLEGWCYERGKLLLAYEFMPNGSLDKLLYDHTAGLPVLPWEVRFNVVAGVAAALAYLHEEWGQKVIHRDVKASNVLLDSNFNPKLADFGLARLTEHSQVVDTTVVAGTLGYLAPELVHTGKATDKTDVYSFGALVLEVMSGQRPLDRGRPEKSTVLIDWVWSAFEDGKLLQIVPDPRLQGVFDEKKMVRAIHVGLLCMHPDPTVRPAMQLVRQILSGDVPLPPLPYTRPRISFSPNHILLPISDLLCQTTNAFMQMNTTSSVATTSSEESDTNSETILTAADFRALR